jgi:hypothetical protein
MGWERRRYKRDRASISEATNTEHENKFTRDDAEYSHGLRDGELHKARVTRSVHVALEVTLANHHATTNGDEQGR